MESPVGALSSTPPRDSKKAWYQYSVLLFGPWAQTTARDLSPTRRRRGSNPLVHRGELQHMAAELGSYKQAHTSHRRSPPGQLQSSGGSSPSRSWVPEPKLCVEVSPTISSRYLSTSRTSSGSFPPSEVTFHVPIARVLVPGIGSSRPPCHDCYPNHIAPAPHGPSCRCCASMKSDLSMFEPDSFSNGHHSAKEKVQEVTGGQSVQQHQIKLDSVFKHLEENIVTFVKNELKKFQKFLSPDYPECLERLRTVAAVCQHQLKSNLQKKYQCVFEGIAKAGNPTLLNQIYTELYITEGGTAEVNDEHENSDDKGSGWHWENSLNTEVHSGLGLKTKNNQDIHFTFPFTFRELNVLKEKKFSLVELVHHFFTETKEAGICRFEEFQVVFIFDGLDECRLPLDFHNNEILTDVTESTSVDVLLTNLIRGKLLPSARLWITTRPAAANQIPPECVDMVTEVRGFTDPQKEEYFRKRFRDEEQASTIISHIKTSRSLHIMCHIPVFCWITATVLEDVLKTREGGELPKTLTEMYIHFLVVQSKVKNIKAASVYSGVFTQIFKEERGLYQDKVFCFVHLSVQEFLAALHVHLTFIKSGVNELSEERSTSLWSKVFRDKPEPTDFYQSPVDEALQSPNGHLDLFLRFLLGLSVQTNQTLLRVEEIQHYLRSGSLSTDKLSPAQWSALVFILLSSEKDLDVFDLKKYSASEEALLRLLPVVKASNKALLEVLLLTLLYFLPEGRGLTECVLGVGGVSDDAAGSPVETLRWKMSCREGSGAPGRSISLPFSPLSVRHLRSTTVLFPLPHRVAAAQGALDDGGVV
ncbi:hypothetical protein L3Q82_005543 [Scortum barcoo]|uniref:Uncharacterized protein n=1 Tax=Scortum barcoo TaxID=214431 RepID=A0ACB8VAK4_9TELE|nr:hypothetical protein L3Q82_005543 [Scortum barcoo]